MPEPAESKPPTTHDTLWRILAMVGALSTGVTIFYMEPFEGVVRLLIRFISATFLSAVVYTVTMSAVSARSARDSQ